MWDAPHVASGAGPHHVSPRHYMGAGTLPPPPPPLLLLVEPSYTAAATVLYCPLVLAASRGGLVRPPANVTAPQVQTPLFYSRHFVCRCRQAA